MKLVMCMFLILLISCSQSYLVTRVIDGDTLELINGEKVRLICVDTPEKGEEGYVEAGDFLKKLVLNKEVTLEKDVNNRDKYKRLLRYVYVDGLFVNHEIVKNGYGKIFRYEPDIKRCGEIES